jgi:hypothetical protein
VYRESLLRQPSDWNVDATVNRIPETAGPGMSKCKGGLFPAEFLSRVDRTELWPMNVVD